VTVFDWPFSNTPVSHLAAFNSMGVWAISPKLVKVTLVPALTRMRPGQYRYSSLLSPIFILSASWAIAPAGPATAIDAKTGEVLWRFQTGFGADAPAVVFEVDGDEYVAIAAGGNSLGGTAYGDAVCEIQTLGPPG
jgi:PQQ enzyme repeat